MHLRQFPPELFEAARIRTFQIEIFEREVGRTVGRAGTYRLRHAHAARLRDFLQTLGFGLEHGQARRVIELDEVTAVAVRENRGGVDAPAADRLP